MHAHRNAVRDNALPRWDPRGYLRSHFTSSEVDTHRLVDDAASSPQARRGRGVLRRGFAFATACGLGAPSA